MLGEVSGSMQDNEALLRKLVQEELAKLKDGIIENLKKEMTAILVSEVKRPTCNTVGVNSSLSSSPPHAWALPPTPLSQHRTPRSSSSPPKPTTNWSVAPDAPIDVIAKSLEQNIARVRTDLKYSLHPPRQSLQLFSLTTFLLF